MFEQGRFIPAAQCYAKSSRSFEFVALWFVDADERDALRIYLSDKLNLLDKRVGDDITSLASAYAQDWTGSDATDDASGMVNGNLPQQVQYIGRCHGCRFGYFRRRELDNRTSNDGGGHAQFHVSLSGMLFLVAIHSQLTLSE